MWKHGAALAFLAAFSLSAEGSEATRVAASLPAAPAQVALTHAAPGHADLNHADGQTVPAPNGPTPADTPPDATLIFGLTGPQLAVGVAIGAGLGAIAVAASGNTLAGAGLGTLAAIYVAHLAVEAVVVGGMFYLWPSEEEAGDAPSRQMPIRGRSASAAPALPPQLLREAGRCELC